MSKGAEFKLQFHSWLCLSVPIKTYLHSSAIKARACVSCRLNSSVTNLSTFSLDGGGMFGPNTPTAGSVTPPDVKPLEDSSQQQQQQQQQPPQQQQQPPPHTQALYPCSSPLPNMSAAAGAGAQMGQQTPPSSPHNIERFG